MRLRKDLHSDNKLNPCEATDVSVAYAWGLKGGDIPDALAKKLGVLGNPVYDASVRVSKVAPAQAEAKMLTEVENKAVRQAETKKERK